MAEATRKLNIYQRINAVMEEVSYIQKEKKAEMRYSIVSHDAVTALLRPSIVQHGIVYHPVRLEFRQDGNRTEVGLTVRFASIENSQDYIDVPSMGYGIDSQDKGPGKAISYAVKYALLKTFGLETGDDPDNDQNVVHKPAEKTADPENIVSQFTVSNKEVLTSANGKEYAVLETDKGKVISFANTMGKFEQGGSYRAVGRVENRDGKQLFIVSSIE